MKPSRYYFSVNPKSFKIDNFDTPRTLLIMNSTAWKGFTIPSVKPLWSFGVFYKPIPPYFPPPRHSNPQKTHAFRKDSAHSWHWSKAKIQAQFSLRFFSIRLTFPFPTPPVYVAFMHPPSCKIFFSENTRPLPRHDGRHTDLSWLVLKQEPLFTSLPATQNFHNTINNQAVYIDH